MVPVMLYRYLKYSRISKKNQLVNQKAGHPAERSFRCSPISPAPAVQAYRRAGKKRGEKSPNLTLEFLFRLCYTSFTRGCSSSVELRLPKPIRWVRLPSSAPTGAVKKSFLHSPCFLFSQQHNARRLADLDRSLIPNGGLYLTDVRLAQQQHGEARLTDAAADGEGKLAV